MLDDAAAGYRTLGMFKRAAETWFAYVLYISAVCSHAKIPGKCKRV